MIVWYTLALLRYVTCICMHVAILIIDGEMRYMNIDTMKSWLEYVFLMCYCDVWLGSAATFWYSNLDQIDTFRHANWDRLPRSNIRIGSNCHVPTCYKFDFVFHERTNYVMKHVNCDVDSYDSIEHVDIYACVTML